MIIIFLYNYRIWFISYRRRKINVGDSLDSWWIFIFWLVLLLYKYILILYCLERFKFYNFIIDLFFIIFLFFVENIRVRIELIKEKILKYVLKVIEEEFVKLVMLEFSFSCVESIYDYFDWLIMLFWGNFRFVFCFMIICYYDWEVLLIIIFIWLL